MTLLAILSALIGAVLAQRFKALVLVPASIGVALASVAVSITDEQDVLSVLSSMAIVAILLQFGFLAGVVTRYGMAAYIARVRGTGARPAVNRS